MTALMHLMPLLALEGHWAGIRAIGVVIILFVALAGSIYMLLWSNFGAKVAYLILMVSLSGFMIVMSLMWVVGAPGTAPGTGPRAGAPSTKILVATEPHWVPFLPDSEQGSEFTAEIENFPNGWTDVFASKTPVIYPGKIDAKGELDTFRATITGALARLAEEKKIDATKPADWTFRPAGSPAITDAEKAIPEATIRFYRKGTPLLVGVTIPATDKHPQVTVFAFRDKGRVFLYALYFLLWAIVSFIFHTWLLARHERKEKTSGAEREVQLV